MSLFGAPAQQQGQGDGIEVPPAPAPGQQAQDRATDTISALSFAKTNANPHFLLSASWDGKVRVYQVQPTSETAANSSMVAEYQHDTAQSSPILDAQWAPAAMQIGTAGANQTVGIFDCTSRQSQTLGNHDQPVRCLRFLPDQQNTLVTGSWDKTIRFWQTTRQGPVETKQLPERVYAMDYAAPHLVVATANRRIVTYDIRNMAQPMNVKPSSLKWQTRCIVAFPQIPQQGSVDTSQAGFAVASIEGRVGINYHEPQFQDKSFSFKCHRKEAAKPKTTSLIKPPATDPNDPKFGAWAVNAMAGCHKGTFATGGSDGTVAIWDHNEKTRLKQITPPEAPNFPNNSGTWPVTALAFSPEARMLAYAQSYDWSMGYQGNTLDKPIHIRVCVLKNLSTELTQVQPEDTDKRATTEKNRWR